MPVTLRTKPEKERNFYQYLYEDCRLLECEAVYSVRNFVTAKFPKCDAVHSV